MPLAFDITRVKGPLCAFSSPGPVASPARSVECTLDTSSMDADETIALETLAKNADLCSTPGEQRSLTGRDFEDYQISSTLK